MKFLQAWAVGPVVNHEDCKHRQHIAQVYFVYAEGIGDVQTYLSLRSHTCTMFYSMRSMQPEGNFWMQKNSQNLPM